MYTKLIWMDMPFYFALLLFIFVRSPLFSQTFFFSRCFSVDITSTSGKIGSARATVKRNIRTQKIRNGSEVKWVICFVVAVMLLSNAQLQEKWQIYIFHFVRTNSTNGKHFVFVNFCIFACMAWDATKWVKLIRIFFRPMEYAFNSIQNLMHNVGDETETFALPSRCHP